eukprot:COSAG05_NODE_19334_length_294_cov_0.958974_1_plen_33_part_01
MSRACAPDDVLGACVAVPLAIYPSFFWRGTGSL